MRDGSHLLIWSAVFGLIILAISTSRNQTRSAEDRNTLSYPRFLVLLSVFGSIAFVGAGIYFKLIEFPGMTIWVSLMFALAALTCGLCAIYCGRIQYKFGNLGVNLQHVIGDAEFIPWSDISNVRLVTDLELRTAAGRSVKFSSSLIGLPELARAVLEHVPVGRIGPLALQRLQTLRAE